MSNFTIIGPGVVLIFEGPGWSGIIGTGSNQHKVCSNQGSGHDYGVLTYPGNFFGGSLQLDGFNTPVEQFPIGFMPTNNIVGSPNNNVDGGPPIPPTTVVSTIATFPDNTPFHQLYSSPIIVNIIFGPSGPGSYTAFLVSNAVITGNYIIVFSQWKFRNLTYPNSNNPIILRPNDRVELYTDDNSYDFSTLTSITLPQFGGVDTFVPFPFETQTPRHIIFKIPPSTPPDDPIHKKKTIINVTGTQFSGTAFYGNPVIISNDNSGVYSITPGLTHDTIYAAAGNPTTVNVKIPDPLAKTGFVGG